MPERRGIGTLIPGLPFDPTFRRGPPPLPGVSVDKLLGPGETAQARREPRVQVAEVLGVSARTVRRLRWRYEKHGFTGLYDHRHHTPRPGRCRWRRCSGCWRSIATATARVMATRASTCGTSIRSRAA